MTLKSADFAAEHKLADALILDPKAGLISLPEDFYEGTLEGTGLTLTQVKKLQAHNSKLLSGVTLVAGEAAAKMFRKDPELTEINVSYHAGSDRAYGYFHRNNPTPVRNVVEVSGSSDRGELGKVHKHLKALFEDINS